MRMTVQTAKVQESKGRFASLVDTLERSEGGKYPHETKRRKRTELTFFQDTRKQTKSTREG